MSDLEVQEGLRHQHPDESIVRSVNFDPVTTAASVTAPTVKAYDEGTEKDVTTTVFPSGSASVSTLVVTLPALTALTDGKTYRVEVKANDGTNDLVSVHRVRCQRV